MANFKVNGITPAFGNIKYGGENVKKIYSGSTLVWPVDNAPIIDETLWEIGGTTTINSSSTSVPGGFNSYVFEAGDTFSAIATATDVEDDPTDLTWSLVSQSSVEGSGQTTVPAWVTGTTNPNGTFTISSTSVVDGNYTFYIKVEDTDGNTDHQIVSISGIVPTINSYFKFIFDSSGSMNETLGYLTRDVLGIGGTYQLTSTTTYTVDGYNNPYTNPECLRYYLQDFYATGLTEAQENAQSISNNPTTNGSNEFDKKIIVTSDYSERPHRHLANNTATSSDINGFGTGIYDAFPNADSVVIAVFMDEASNININSYPNGQYPSGGLASLSGITDVKNLKTIINNLKNSKGSGFYRGLFYPVKVDNQTTEQSALEQYYIASVNNTDQFNPLDPDYADVTGLNEHGHLLASANVELLDDGNTTPGYYTKRIVNDLKALGYDIPDYAGAN